jgi:hypothetical protein
MIGRSETQTRRPNGQANPIAVTTGQRPTVSLSRTGGNGATGGRSEPQDLLDAPSGGDSGVTHKASARSMAIAATPGACVLKFLLDCGHHKCSRGAFKCRQSSGPQSLPVAVRGAARQHKGIIRRERDSAPKSPASAASPGARCAPNRPSCCSSGRTRNSGANPVRASINRVMTPTSTLIRAAMRVSRAGISQRSCSLLRGIRLIQGSSIMRFSRSVVEESVTSPTPAGAFHSSRRRPPPETGSPSACTGRCVLVPE